MEFFVPYNKPHGARRLGKNYHMRFDIKLGHVTCAIRRIICVCTELTSMLDKPWTPGLPPQQQAC